MRNSKRSDALKVVSAIAVVALVLGVIVATQSDTSPDYSNSKDISKEYSPTYKRSIPKSPSYVDGYAINLANIYVGLMKCSNASRSELVSHGRDVLSLRESILRKLNIATSKAKAFDMAFDKEAALLWDGVDSNTLSCESLRKASVRSVEALQARGI